MHKDMVFSKEHKVYIILTYSGSVVSKAIKRVTNKDYTHVSISLEQDLSCMYSFARLHRHFILPAGFVTEDVNKESKFKDTECLVYELEIDGVKKLLLDSNIKSFLDESKRYRYNVAGLLGVYMGIPIERDYRYFCSQFVAEVLKRSCINILEKPSGLVEPADFILCEGLKEVYRGKLYEYGGNYAENNV